MGMTVVAACGVAQAVGSMAQAAGNVAAKIIPPSAPPSAAAYSDYTGEAFTASWRAPQGVEITVFSVKQEMAKFGSDFTGVKATDGRIDAENPNLPEGWTVDVSANGSEDVRDGALIFDAFGDRVRLPYMPGILIGLDVDCEMVDVVGSLDFKNCGELTVSYHALNGEVLARRSFYGLNFEARKNHNIFANMQFGSVDVAFVELEWTAPEGGTNITGKLKLNRVDYAYMPHEVKVKQAVEQSPYRVEGLDASKDYFFYLSNENGYSETVRVEEFLPIRVKDADMVGATSFRARWEVNPKAWSYGVKVYEYTTHDADETMPMLAEDFSASTAGSYEQPMSVTSFDGLTQTPGWTGNRSIVAEGMIGADAGGNYRTFGYVLTPKLNLAAVGGTYTVTLEGVAEPGTQLSVYHKDYMINYQLAEHFINVGADGRFSDTWTMTDGDDHTQIQIVSKALKRFMISRMEVAQTIPAGTVTRSLVNEAVVEGTAADSFAVEALAPGRTYGYEITGHRLDLYGWEQTAVADRVVMVTTLSKEDGVDTPLAASVSLRLLPSGAMKIAASEAGTLTLYNLAGRVVASHTYPVGTSTFVPTLPAGLYMAAMPGAALKVTVR